MTSQRWWGRLGIEDNVDHNCAASVGHGPHRACTDNDKQDERRFWGTPLYLTSRTNLVQVPEAIRVASQLHPGISEADATKFLQQDGVGSCVIVTNGTTNVYSLGGTSNVYSLSIGSSVGWTTFYELAEGCSLGLEMRPSQIRTDGIWGGNGLLERAIIQSNSINIVTISLTNKP